MSGRIASNLYTKVTGAGPRFSLVVMLVMHLGEKLTIPTDSKREFLVQ